MLLSKLNIMIVERHLTCSSGRACSLSSTCTPPCLLPCSPTPKPSAPELRPPLTWTPPSTLATSSEAAYTVERARVPASRSRKPLSKPSSVVFSELLAIASGHPRPDWRHRRTRAGLGSRTSPATLRTGHHSPHPSAPPRLLPPAAKRRRFNPG